MSDAEASGSGEIETRMAAEQVGDLDTLVTMSGEALDTGGPCWWICCLKSCEKVRRPSSLIDEFTKFNEHYAIFISCNIFSLFLIFIFSDRILP